MKPLWLCKEVKINSCIVESGPSSIVNVFSPHSSMAKGLRNFGGSPFFIILLIGFLTSLSLNSVYGEAQEREINLASINTIWKNESYQHTFSICFSELLEGDMIFVSSDSTIKRFLIQNNTSIETCKIIDIGILAVDPASVNIDYLMIENKDKTHQRLENKSKSLQNIIHRLTEERTELIKESSMIEDNSDILDKADSKQLRISDLEKYHKKVVKKLQLISSI